MSEVKDISEIRKTGPIFENLEKRRDQIEAMFGVRSWLKSLDWPSYVGRFSFAEHGYFWIYPEDISKGFPEHFQIDMLKVLPINGGKLKREFREKQGEIYWVGEIAVKKLPKYSLEKISDCFHQVRVIFECGTKTNCKLIPKTKQVTYFELDCSSEARAEVAPKNR